MNARDKEILDNFKGPNPRAYTHQRPGQDAMKYILLTIGIMVAVLMIVELIQVLWG